MVDFSVGLCFLILLLASRAPCADSKRSRDVIPDILQNYDPRHRPVYNHSTTTMLYVYPRISQIIDLDTKTQTLNSKIWMHMTWQDEFLRWNLSEYDGLDSVILPSSDVWTPDFFFYSSLDVFHPCKVFASNADVRVNFDGHMQWVPPAILISSCFVDLTAYPFDTQVCPLLFGPWASNMAKINITVLDPFRVFKSDRIYKMNGELDLIKTECSNKVITYPEEDEDVDFAHLHCFLHIRRRPLYYILYFIAPCIVLLVIGSLTFCTPAESGEKVVLSTTVMLSMIVFLLVAMEILPSTSLSIPMLAVFIGCSTLLLAFTTVASVVTVALVNRDFSKRPPHLILKLCKLCTKQSQQRDESLNSKGKTDQDQPKSSMTSNSEPLWKKEWILISRIVNKIAFLIYIVACLLLFIYLCISASRP